MSKNYNQLSSEQRYQIEALLQNEITQKEVARIIGVSPSTVCRELKRNTPKRGRGALEYRAKNAQRRTSLRHQTKSKHIRFSDEMKETVREKLQVEKYSPELICQQAKTEGRDFVSHETIYKWIWSTKFSNRRSEIRDKKLYTHLAHGKRRRKRGLRRDSRGIIPNRIGIDKRPKIVQKRRRLGDMEVDLMMGKNHKGAVLVVIDRTSLKTKLRLLKSKESLEVKRKVTASLKKIKDVVKTLTFDNDQAFSKHESIGKALNAKTYFTRPYTSQDKGSVENRIGILRRFFPKRTDLTKVNSQRVKEVENLLNNRPVRKFNYKTPNQVFSQKIALIT
jgi:IS30 family transposase